MKVKKPFKREFVKMAAFSAQNNATNCILTN